MAIFVVYRGDVREPDDLRPFSVPGMPPFPKGQAREITEDYVRRQFNRDAQGFVAFLFGESGAYNANMPAPRFTVHAGEAPPESVPLEGQSAPPVTVESPPASGDNVEEVNP